MHSAHSRYQRNRRRESWGAAIGGVFAVCVAFVLFVYAVIEAFGAYE